MANIIEIDNLNKTFGEVRAVKNLSLRVKTGEFFAFLGVNGAGKSTTISIMCGNLEKDSGTVKIAGKNIDTDFNHIASKIGVVFQNSVLDGVLSVRDNLLTRASLYGIYGDDAKKKIASLAKILDFENLLDRTVSKLSGGQRRRVDIARALIHDPQILILDEPTTGLDPQTRKIMWSVINNYRHTQNLTVFLTTHYMEETVDADYVVILDNGSISAEGTPLQLKNTYTGDYISLYNVPESELERIGIKYEKIKDYYRIEVQNTAEAKDLIIKYPEIFNDFEIAKGKMDDVFLAVTGKTLAGDN